MKKTKLIAVVLSLCMLLALVPVAALAAEFTDIDEATNENYADAIDRWSGEGVISGVGNDTFDPKGTMTRVQGFGIIANLLNLTEKADLSEYTDVPTDGWKADYLAKVVAAGIVTGYPDKTLRPEGELTREQMFVTIAKTLGVQPVETDDEEFEDIGEAADYAAPYINALHKMGAVNGSNGNVNPLDILNRESAALLLDNLIGGYANTEGETVEIEKGKITLVVADNVAVKGEVTEEDMPIVVAGQAGTVDMKEVTGDVAPTVNVTVSDVTINDAPVGTTVSATETVENVTVGDQTVAAGEEVVVPEPEPEPTPVPVIPYNPNPITENTINDIIETGRQTVNGVMKNNGVPYAEIPEITGSGSNRAVTVNIYDGSTNVLTVYSHIVDKLVEALNAHSSEVTSITAKTAIEGAQKDGVDGVAYKNTLKLTGQQINQGDVILFVKALVGTEYHRGTEIKGLADKWFEVEISDAGKDDVTTTVTYKVTFKMASLLDKVIDEEITATINPQMSAYATAEWDGPNHTLNVVIKHDATTQVGQVYTDIEEFLCTAFNKARTTLTSVVDNLNPSGGEGQAKLPDLNSDLTGTDLKTFVSKCKVKKDNDTQTVKDLLVTSQGLITKLDGYHFEILVTAKGDSSSQVYKIVFKLDNA